MSVKRTSQRAVMTHCGEITGELGSDACQPIISFQCIALSVYRSSELLHCISVGVYLCKGGRKQTFRVKVPMRCIPIISDAAYWRA